MWLHFWLFEEVGGGGACLCACLECIFCVKAMAHVASMVGMGPSGRG